MPEQILDQLEPSHVTIGGKKYPLLFSMRAAAMMEKELETPYVKIVEEIFRTGDKDKDTGMDPMAWERQAMVISCLMRAAGADVTTDMLLDGVRMGDDAQRLCKAAIQEMTRKTPKGKAKNG